MKILRVRAHDFGKLSGDLDLAPGLTVVHGANEAGKSTWLQAIFAGLCGRRRGRGANTREANEFKRQYEPWNGRLWRVTVKLQLDGGRRVEIQQLDLKKKKSVAHDVDTGRPIDNELMYRGSVDGSRFLGLNREVMPSTLVIGQADILRLRQNKDHEASALRKELQRAAASAGKAATAVEALDRLTKYAREQVGAERRNSTRPLQRAVERLARAGRELEQGRARHQERTRLERGLTSARDRAERAEVLTRRCRQLLAQRDLKRLDARLIEIECLARRFPGGQPPPAPGDGPDASAAQELLEAVFQYRGRTEEPAQLCGANAEDLAGELATLPGSVEGDREPAPTVAAAARVWREAAAESRALPAQPETTTGETVEDLERQLQQLPDRPQGDREAAPEVAAATTAWREATAESRALPAEPRTTTGETVEDLERQLQQLPDRPQGDREAAPEVAEATTAWREATAESRALPAEPRTTTGEAVEDLERQLQQLPDRPQGDRETAPEVAAATTAWREATAESRALPAEPRTTTGEAVEDLERQLQQLPDRPQGDRETAPEVAAATTAWQNAIERKRFRQQMQPREPAKPPIAASDRESVRLAMQALLRPSVGAGDETEELLGRLRVRKETLHRQIKRSRTKEGWAWCGATTGLPLAALTLLDAVPAFGGVGSVILIIVSCTFILLSRRSRSSLLDQKRTLSAEAAYAEAEARKHTQRQDRRRTETDHAMRTLQRLGLDAEPDAADQALEHLARWERWENERYEWQQHVAAARTDETTAETALRAELARRGVVELKESKETTDALLNRYLQECRQNVQTHRELAAKRQQLTLQLEALRRNQQAAAEQRERWQNARSAQAEAEARLRAVLDQRGVTDPEQEVDALLGRYERECRDNTRAGRELAVKRQQLNLRLEARRHREQAAAEQRERWQNARSAQAEAEARLRAVLDQRSVADLEQEVDALLGRYERECRDNTRAGRELAAKRQQLNLRLEARRRHEQAAAEQRERWQNARSAQAEAEARLRAVLDQRSVADPEQEVDALLGRYERECRDNTRAGRELAAKRQQLNLRLEARRRNEQAAHEQRERWQNARSAQAEAEARLRAVLDQRGVADPEKEVGSLLGRYEQECRRNAQADRELALKRQQLTSRLEIRRSEETTAAEQRMQREQAEARFRRALAGAGFSADSGADPEQWAVDWLKQREARLGRLRTDWERLQGLLDGRTREDIAAECESAAARLRELENLVRNDGEIPSRKAGGIPVLEGLDSGELERRLTGARKEAIEAGNEVSNCEGRLAAEANLPSLAELEEERAAAEREVALLRRAADIVQATREHLEAAQDEVHRILAPDLRAALATRLDLVTDGRYSAVRIDPEEGLEVRLEVEDGVFRSATELSHGTIDQVYLLLRIALAEALGDRTESAPLFLDDATVHCDTDRTMRFLDLLLELSEERQIVVFSQEEGVRVWAKRRLAGDARHLLIELGGNGLPAGNMDDAEAVAGTAPAPDQQHSFL